MDAIKRGASDIHFETYDKTFRVRYRIDGVLYEVMNPPGKIEKRHHFPVKNHVQPQYRRETAPTRRTIEVAIRGG